MGVAHHNRSRLSDCTSALCCDALLPRFQRHSLTPRPRLLLPPPRRRAAAARCISAPPRRWPNSSYPGELTSMPDATCAPSSCDDPSLHVWHLLVGGCWGIQCLTRDAGPSPLCLSLPAQTGETPLHCAAERSDEKLVEWFAAHGADVNTRPEMRCARVLVASSSGREQVVPRPHLCLRFRVCTERTIHSATVKLILLSSQPPPARL